MTHNIICKFQILHCNTLIERDFKVSCLFCRQRLRADAFNELFPFHSDIKGSSILFLYWNTEKSFKWNTLFAITLSFLSSSVHTAACVIVLHQSELYSWTPLYFRTTGFTYNVIIIVTWLSELFPSIRTMRVSLRIFKSLLL